MKVRELIKQLQLRNPDAEVTFIGEAGPEGVGEVRDSKTAADRLVYIIAEEG